MKWLNRENRKSFLINLGNKLGYTTNQDWYRLTKKNIVDNNGRGLLRLYKGGKGEILKDLFPEYDWKEWLFDNMPTNFWNKKENRTKYFLWLIEKLNISIPVDMHKITASVIINNNGRGILPYYNGSAYSALTDCLSINYYRWQSAMVPHHFWDNLENRKAYLNWLSKILNYKTYEDWYNLTVKDFYGNNGSGLISTFYKGSIINVLKDLFPEYDWKEWFLTRVSSKYWLEKKNRQEYLSWIGEKLGFNSLDDYYKITIKDFYNNYGSGFITQKIYNCSPIVAITDCIPEYNWEIEKFYTHQKKQQRLYNLIKQLFPNHEIKYNFKHPDILYVKSKRKIELDIYIPGLMLAIEYQGEQHYYPIPYWGGEKSLNEIKNRDKYKKTKCLEMGIDLIEIKYDWNGRKETLEKLISKYL